MRFLGSVGVLGFAIASLGSTAAPVYAAGSAGSDCICVASSAGDETGAVGMLVASVGKVFLTGSTGYQPALIGSELAPGTQVETGPSSSAGVKVGSSCQMSLGANASVLLQQSQSDICVKKSGDVRLTSLEADTPAPPPPVTNAAPPVGGIEVNNNMLLGTGLVVGLGAAAGAGLLLGAGQFQKVSQ